MKTTYTVKNFRVFDENGATIDFAPITILTGRNSAGKSSVTKSIELLDSFLQQVKRDADKGNKITLESYKLDFSKKPLSLMGGYDKVVHRGSPSKEMTFEYSIYSTLLSKDLCVSLTFCSDAADVLNNGFLIRFVVKTDECVIYRSDKDNGSYYNLRQIIAPFLRYSHAKNVLFSKPIGVKRSENEREYSMEQEQEDLSKIKLLDKVLVKDAILRASCDEDCQRNLVPEEIIKWSEENDSLFMMPVIENLDKLSKADFRKETEENLYKHIWNSMKVSGKTAVTAAERAVAVLFADDLYETGVSKMIDEFEASSFDSFKQFMLSKEHNFLAKVDVNRNGTLFTRVSPRIPVADCMGIRNAEQLELADKYLKKDREFSFEDYYVACSYLESSDKMKGNTFFKYSDGMCSHYIYERLCQYACLLVKEALLPDWVGMISRINAHSVSVKRQYLLSDESDNFSSLLKCYLEQKGRILRLKEHKLAQLQTIADVDKNSYNSFIETINEYFDFQPGDFVNHWLQELGIGSSLEIKVEGEGCVYVRLHKENDDEGIILADEGFGITQLVYLLLAVETKIMGVKYPNLIGEPAKPSPNFDVLMLAHKLNIEDIIQNREVLTVSIEEPEIHLHPQFQSKLADLFVDAMKYGIHFVVETHSEYLIRKLQYLVATSKYVSQEELETECPFKVFYFAEQGISYDMQFRPNGKFMQAFGEGFFDEADKWVMKMFELEEE